MGPAQQFERAGVPCLSPCLCTHAPSHPAPLRTTRGPCPAHSPPPPPARLPATPDPGRCACWPWDWQQSSSSAAGCSVRSWLRGTHRCAWPRAPVPALATAAPPSAAQLAHPRRQRRPTPTAQASKPRAAAAAAAALCVSHHPLCSPPPSPFPHRTPPSHKNSSWSWLLASGRAARCRRLRPQPRRCASGLWSWWSAGQRSMAGGTGSWRWGMVT